MKAVLRWAWRMFRRDWRQQALVLALLTVAVAASTFGATFAFNFATSQAAQLGSASNAITFAGDDPAATAVDLATARRTFGTVDVLTQRYLAVPGSTETVEVRGQDPAGPYSRPMLRLDRGRYPAGAGEVAITDGVAQTLGLGVGGVFDLDPARPRVVGIVENPSDLRDEFALAASSDPGSAKVDDVTFLVRATNSEVEAFRTAMTARGNVRRISWGADAKKVAALLTFGLASVGMLLVALIAAAAFVVLAQRRLRHLGLLAAVGAAEGHVRLVTLMNGLIVGLIAGGAGTALGVAVWAAAEPAVESASNHRIDGLGLPAWVVLTSVVLAVVTATAAAWWPARTVARVPVVRALSSRPPDPRPAHRPTLLGLLLVGIGILCLWASKETNGLLIVVGVLATPVGVLLTAPLAVRLLGPIAPRLPVAGRIALRDLARHQSRSSAALAAIGLALGVPVAIIVQASISKQAPNEGNLASSQLVFRIGQSPQPFVVPTRTEAEQAATQQRVTAFAATLDHARVVPLDQLVHPDQPPEPGLTRPGEVAGVQLGRRANGTIYGVDAFLATPDLLALYGADVAALQGHDVASVYPNLVVPGKDRNPAPLSVLPIGPLRQSSVPNTFVSAATAQRLGWTALRSGWFVETNASLTAKQRRAARQLAADAGLTVEVRDQQAQLGAFKAGATAGGTLLALGVLAMTVGLIRGESAAEGRILAAVGAPRAVRRRLNGATAGSLALLGVVLGIAGAYLVMVGAYSRHLHDLRSIPVANLLVLLVGVPILAAGCGFAFGGREPDGQAQAALLT